ncbi:DUF4097 family beta strand repeat protein [Aquimarina sp. U1-2]|uniref:DUF4097 family beta strand repeat-containing protein n=1 Tax=Aquimarina sp. U1-2 TaxID=2823141 RepID=UPI001AECFA3F|nr:DUF4097 family beta strand repeat-containing protein [Aquimarina sp. U1-2]MBP2831995.1 DUF4097 family beta strand repeat protein [Aquimarina sp. U1-2]
MKIAYYKLVFLLLFPTLLFAINHGDLKGKYNKEKTLNKEFKVNRDALLKISNDYGNLDITSWNENRIVLQVTIKVSGNNEEKVAKKLASIDVDFENSPTMVSARTVFNKNNDSWWSKWSNSWNNSTNMKINYTVKVPVTNSIDLSNDYGNITLDKIEGKAKINCDYGQIILGELLADDNYINIDYTNNSSITYMKSGKINADYSDFEVGDSQQVDLTADYTQSKFKSVANLTYNCDYGGIRIENADKIIGSSDYVSTKIGAVSKELNIESDYGSLEIYALLPSFKSITVDTDYTRVDISYNEDCVFDFDIKASYGGIQLDEGINIQKKYVKDSKKDYQGYYGKKNSGNTISITSSYGGIKLRKK